MQSFEDPTGWNVGIVDGGIGEASVSAGGIFHTEILMVHVLPPLKPNLLYHAVVYVRNKSIVKICESQDCYSIDFQLAHHTWRPWCSGP